MILNSIEVDVVVVGAGPSGLFAASKFLQIEKSVMILEQNGKIGGQINLYNEKNIYNIPLFDCIKSKDIINNLYNSIKNNKNLSLHIDTEIIDIKYNNEQINILFFNKKTQIKQNVICKYLILAFGKGTLQPNKLQLENCQQFENKTLLYHIDDINVFKDKNVVLAGGGDSVIDWCCGLYDICKNITIIHRREINHNDNSNFPIFNNFCKKNKILTKVPYTLQKLNGDNGRLTSIDILNNNNNLVENIKCDYLLAFYGIKTVQNNIEIYKKLGIEFYQNKVKVDIKHNETNAKNIFAVGDCCYFDGKIDNITMGFADVLKSFYEICARLTNTIKHYEHK